MKTVKELRAECKHLGIKGYSRMKKADLEAALVQHEYETKIGNEPTFRPTTEEVNQDQTHETCEECDGGFYGKGVFRKGDLQVCYGCFHHDPHEMLDADELTVYGDSQGPSPYAKWRAKQKWDEKQRKARNKAKADRRRVRRQRGRKAGFAA